MYRENDWTAGYYIDNHKKYECKDCGRQFIIGENLSENCSPEYPVCPYCGQGNIECVVQTEDKELAQLEDDLGCLAIHIEKTCFNCIGYQQEE